MIESFVAWERLRLEQRERLLREPEAFRIMSSACFTNQWGKESRCAFADHCWEGVAVEDLEGIKPREPHHEED